MQKAAGVFKILLESAEPEAGTVKDPSVSYFRPVCADQARNRDPDAEKLVFIKRKRFDIFIDMITDSMNILFRVGISNRKHFAQGIAAVEIDSQYLKLLFKYLDADGYPEIRNNDICGSFPADKVRGNLAFFFYHPHCFKVGEFGCNGRPAETQII